MKIATLGPEGTYAFVRAVGRPTHGRWPQMTGTYFTGLETVAGPIVAWSGRRQRALAEPIDRWARPP